MTKIEQLREIFNHRKNIIKDRYSYIMEDPKEKEIYRWRIYEIESIQNIIEQMIWTGQITIKFNN